MYFLLLKSIIKNTLIFLLSLYVSFLLVETILIYTNLDRKSVKSDLQKIIEIKKNKLDVDKRNIAEFYLDYKKINQQVVLSTTTTGFNGHLDPSFILNNGIKVTPLSGISNKETILCNEFGYFAKYKSDNYGFNNPSNWKSKYDFLLLGDSIVEGHCLNEQYNIAGSLKDLLKKKDSVLNLGRGGNGPIKNYAILKEYINLVDVDNILYFHTAGDDLDDLNKELKNSLFKKYYEEIEYTQNLHNLQKLIDKNMIIKTQNTISKFIDQKKNIKQKKNHVYEFIKLNRTVRFKNKLFRGLKDQRDDQELIKNEFKEVMKLANDLANQKKINFYFVYVPTYFLDHKNIMGNEKIRLKNDQYYLDILSVINELKIPIIDLKAELFKKDNDPLSILPFRTYGHFTEKGNRLISNIIINKILLN